MADLTTLLKELIRIPSVTSDQSASRDVMAWFKRKTAGLPLHVTDFEQGGYPSLILTTRPTKHPRLMLMAHIDVVPGTPDQFEPYEKRGRLYGRGTFDMKFAAAVYAKLLIELGDDLRHLDLGVVLTSDEEQGGICGVDALMKHGYRTDFAVMPDSGPGWGVEAQAKGYHEVRIEATGTAGHGAQPWAGDNAIVNLMRYLDDLKVYFPAEPCGDPDHYHDTINIGVIRGGEVGNQIPAYAEAIVNMRTVDVAATTLLGQRLKNLEAGHPHVKVVPLFTNNPLKLPLDHPYTKRYMELVREVAGTEPRLVRSHGASDLRYMVPLGIAALAAKPIGGPQHADGEWIDLRSLEQYYEIIRRLVGDTARLDT